MKQLTEAHLRDLLRQAYNTGFDSSERFNGEYLNSIYPEGGTAAIEKVHLDCGSEDWVVARDNAITKLIDSV